MVTYVLNKNGQPLMPIHRCGKVRRLLKSKKAKVVHKEPFTIQLLFNVENTVSDLYLGVDTGSSKIGTAVVDNNQVVLYTSEVKIRNDISTKMKRRCGYRRARRIRKLRYRKPRFLNRANSIKKDRFSPTMISKINSHKREIEFIKSILPIKTLVLETGKFDTTLLDHKDEAFNRHWGYQKGPAYGYKNNHDATLNRDNYTCQCCKTKKGTLHVHHIIYRSNGGSDKMENLITLCEDCHKKLHDGELKEFESKLVGKRKGTLKYATQMNSIRVQLLRHYSEAIETFGFITKANRELSTLAKEHYSDAITIACGCIPDPTIDCKLYKKRHIAKGQYQLYQGQNSDKKLPRGKVQGFLNRDIVEYKDQLYLIKGLISSGYCKLMNIDGVEQKFTDPKTVKLNVCERISARSTTRCISQKII
jgi:hypothetical protein